MGEILKLNGLWNFTTDPDQLGVEEEWYLGLPASDRYPVPGVWQTYRDDLYNYVGYAWYSREFSVSPETRVKRILLEFAAVDYQAEVWLNGKSLGSHEGGYTPFRFEITGLVRGGEPNLLVVRVNDPEENAEIPHGKQGSWYSRVSGIWQEVRLFCYDEAFVEKVRITPDLDQDTAHFAVVCNGAAGIENPSLEMIVYDPKAQQQVIVKQSFPYQEGRIYTLQLKNPCYWAPRTPWLYHTEILLKDGHKVRDRYQTYFGMRKIHWQEGQLYLNNEPFYLRGALDQGFWPETIYYAKDETLIKDEIKKAKMLGFNLLRKHIKTEDPRYLYWADRLGMLIWAEPPNCGKWSPLANTRFKEELFALIDRDYNHPSIVIWSIYNEEWGLDWKLRSDREKQVWVEDLYQQVKTADPTRLVCDNSGWAHVRTDLNDYHRYFAVPELYREWQKDLGRILAKPADNYVLPTNHQGEPILISEFGMWSLPENKQFGGEQPTAGGWFNGSARIFTEEFKVPATALTNFTRYGLDRIFTDLNELARATQERQWRGVKFIIEEIRKQPQIAGYVVTELTDIEWETNGFLTYDRQPKAGFTKAKDFNGETVIGVELDKRNLWSGETLRVRPTVVNNTNQSLHGEIFWTLNGTPWSKQVPLAAFPYGVSAGEEIIIQMPKVDRVGRFRLYYEFRIGRKVICQNEEELTITPEEARNVNGLSVYPGALPPTFIAELVKNGFTIGETLENGSLYLTTAWTPEVTACLQAGGEVLYLAEDNISGEGISFRRLVDGENWDRAAAINFLDPSRFPGLLLPKIPGWELADLYPNLLLTNLDELPDVKILGGSFQGWLGNIGGFLVETKFGSGRLWITTLRLLANYNKHPIGTLFLNQLVKEAQR